ncbi:hypothetical protein HYU22_04270 [Candidatus Woesearchaeota archaeon]|nr:hypothetical protein [Candidatus Woesearchaeota archaeon]
MEPQTHGQALREVQEGYARLAAESISLPRVANTIYCELRDFLDEDPKLYLYWIGSWQSSESKAPRGQYGVWLDHPYGPKCSEWDTFAPKPRHNSWKEFNVLAPNVSDYNAAWEAANSLLFKPASRELHDLRWIIGDYPAADHSSCRSLGVHDATAHPSARVIVRYFPDHEYAPKVLQDAGRITFNGDAEAYHQSLAEYLGLPRSDQTVALAHGIVKMAHVSPFFFSELPKP